MAHPRYTREEIISQGKALYQERIRQEVEPASTGQFLVVDVETGDYELGAESAEVVNRAREKHPDAPLFLMRVGYPTAVKLGGRFRAQRP